MLQVISYYSSFLRLLTSFDQEIDAKKPYRLDIHHLESCFWKFQDKTTFDSFKAVGCSEYQKIQLQKRLLYFSLKPALSRCERPLFRAT